MLGQTLCKCNYEIVTARKLEALTAGRMNKPFIELKRSTEGGTKNRYMLSMGLILTNRRTYLQTKERETKSLKRRDSLIKTNI